MTDPSGPLFVISGGRDGTSTYNQGTGGSYWSSSAYPSASYSYRLRLYDPNSKVIPADNYFKKHGFTLRYLA